jgi:hypothetical protein
VSSDPKPGDVVSAAQQGIAEGIRRYYQLECVGPTSHRLQMLLTELRRRAETKTNGGEAAHENDRQSRTQEPDEVDEGIEPGRA